jgi:ABC-type transport system involved in cytochrome c biogenesis permease subunit
MLHQPMTRWILLGFLWEVFMNILTVFYDQNDTPREHQVDTILKITYILGCLLLEAYLFLRSQETLRTSENSNLKFFI